MVTNATRKVGWVGLGTMGGAMAANLQRYLQHHGSEPLRVFNRTASKCRSIEEIGGKRCESISALTSQCDVIFMSTSDDATDMMIIEQIIEAGDIRGKVVIDTTTVHPDTTKAVNVRLSEHGALFAAMPVFGAAPVAKAGKLLAGFAGPDVVYDIISPMIKDAVAREVLNVGSEPEKALLLKTTGNVLMASLMQVIAEAHVLASKSGLPASTLERLLELNFGSVMHSDSIRMTTGVYCPAPGESPWSDLELGIKDVGHGIDIAQRAGVELPVGRLALENMKVAKDWAEEDAKVHITREKRKLDSSGLFGVVRKQSGLDFETELVKNRDVNAG